KAGRGNAYLRISAPDHLACADACLHGAQSRHRQDQRRRPHACEDNEHAPQSDERDRPAANRIEAPEARKPMEPRYAAKMGTRKYTPGGMWPVRQRLGTRALFGASNIALQLPGYRISKSMVAGIRQPGRYAGSPGR